MYPQLDALKERIDLLTGENSDADLLIDIVNLCKLAWCNIEDQTREYYLVKIEANDINNNNLLEDYYIPIGYTTARIARENSQKYVNTLGSQYDVYDIIKLSKEQYEDYISLANLLGLISRLPSLQYSSYVYDQELEQTVKKDIRNLRNKLNLPYEWQQVVLPVYFKQL